LIEKFKSVEFEVLSFEDVTKIIILTTLEKDENE